jgi:hypothetical protein
LIVKRKKLIKVIDMDAILFSVNPKMANVDDAVWHLDKHDELYWEVGFPIKDSKFIYPILGYMHLCGKQVGYVAMIRKIIPFSPRHYEDRKLSKMVKPDIWLRGWEDNLGNCRQHPWKHAIVMTRIEPFSYNTCQFKRYGGDIVSRPPQNYIRVLPPK